MYIKKYLGQDSYCRWSYYNWGCCFEIPSAGTVTLPAVAALSYTSVVGYNAAKNLITQKGRVNSEGSGEGGGNVESTKLSENHSNELTKPEGWIEKPSKKGGGKRWIDPNNSRNNIRQMPGDKSSPHASQQKPYIKYQKNGRFYDKFGKQVSSGDLPEAHIPASEYNPSLMPKF